MVLKFQEFLKEKLEYQGVHYIPNDLDFNATLDDLTKGGELVSGDFYKHPEWYGFDRRNLADRESLKVIMKVRGKPDATVTIYRALPKEFTEINNGDWVTLSKDYAKHHAYAYVEDGHVISKKCRAKDIQWDANAINEFMYFENPD